MALSFDDPLPIEDVAAYGQALSDWLQHLSPYGQQPLMTEELIPRGKDGKPMPSCLEGAADVPADIACEAEGVSKATLWAISLITGHPATMMRDEFIAQAKTTIHDAWLPIFDANAERTQAVMQRADLIDPDDAGSPTDRNGEQ